MIVPTLPKAISDTDSILNLLQKRDAGNSTPLVDEALPESLSLADAAELKEFSVRFEARVLQLKEKESRAGSELVEAAMECAGGLRRNLAAASATMELALEAATALDALGAK